MARVARWGFLPTGDSPTSHVMRVITYPNTRQWHMAVRGCLSYLADAEAWELVGTETPDEAAQEGLNVMASLAPMLGVIMPYAGSTLPAWALPCDGSSYNRNQYPLLWQAIDTSLKAGDTFTTPDLRGRFVLGEGNLYGFGQTGGSETHTLSELEMPMHTHTETSSTPTVINGGLEAPASAAVPTPSVTGSAGGGQAHNNMPPYYVLSYIIVAR